MQRPHPHLASRSVRSKAVLGVPLLLTAVVGYIWGSITPVWAETEHASHNQTIPPITVDIESDPMIVDIGEVITYTITVNNSISDTSSTYTPTVIVENVFPPELAVNSESLAVEPSDEQGNTEQSTAQLMWSGQLDPTRSITITYSGIVSEASKLCSITNRVILSEARDGPSDKHIVAVQSHSTKLASVLCQVRLPQILIRELPDITNGDFELGPENWNQQPDSPALIVNTSELDLPQADSGQWFVWLGGQNNAVHSLQQSVENVPFGITGGSETAIGIGIGYLYWVGSTNESCSADQAAVSVSRIGDNPATVQNIYQLCSSHVTWDQDKESNGWEHGVLDLDGIGGGEVEIALSIQTGSTALSNFFVDDIHFCSDNRNGNPDIRACTQ